VAVIDRDTRCDRVADDIDEELDDRHPTNTVYVYYGSGSRYYRNKSGRRKYGHRYKWWDKNRKNRRSRSRSRRDKKDKDDDHDHDHDDHHGGGHHGGDRGGGGHGDADRGGDGHGGGHGRGHDDDEDE